MTLTLLRATGRDCCKIQRVKIKALKPKFEHTYLGSVRSRPLLCASKIISCVGFPKSTKSSSLPYASNHAAERSPPAAVITLLLLWLPLLVVVVETVVEAGAGPWAETGLLRALVVLGLVPEWVPFVCLALPFLPAELLLGDVVPAISGAVSVLSLLAFVPKLVFRLRFISPSAASEEGKAVVCK